MSEARQPDPGPAPAPSRWTGWLAAGLIAAAVAAAYGNSLSNPFFFDDDPSLADNPSIRNLRDLGQVLQPTAAAGGAVARPLLNLSFAINYALGGMDPRGFRATNVAIHILAAIVLFGVARRIFLRMARPRGATLAALVAALLWALHPLQTESVACVIHRSESLMGLFFLLTVYCFIRSAEPGGKDRVFIPGAWACLSVGACLLGMATKEVMATGPVVIFLLDRTFYAGTFSEAWRRRRPYYLALAATWIVLGWILVRAGGTRGTAAGFGLGVTAWSYALTQCRAIILYLRLAVWPHPLVADYGTALAGGLGEVAPQVLALVVLAAAAAAAFLQPARRGAGPRALGFAGAWVLLILAPSSSVVPLVAQTVAEHRMYLPLAALASAFTVLLAAGLGRTGLLLGLGLALALGATTARRNQDYRSALSIWSDTVAKVPGNPRAQTNLGLALAAEGRLEEAAAHYRTALAADPAYADAENDLGAALVRLGRKAEGMKHYERAIALARRPSNAEAHNNLGSALASEGRQAEAAEHFRRAVALNPGLAEAESNLGVALARTGRPEEGIGHCQRALDLRPNSMEMRTNLGIVLVIAGRAGEGAAILEKVLAARTDLPEARDGLAQAWLSLGTARARAGQPAAALELLEKSVGLAPGLAAAHNEMGNALAQLGRGPEAISAYERAVRIEPGNAAMHYHLGNALRAAGRRSEARSQYEEALRLDPGLAPAEDNLGITLAELGRPVEAIGHFEAALRLKADYPEAHQNLALVLRALGRTAEAGTHFREADRLRQARAGGQRPPPSRD